MYDYFIPIFRQLSVILLFVFYSLSPFFNLLFFKWMTIILFYRIFYWKKSLGWWATWYRFSENKWWPHILDCIVRSGVDFVGSIQPTRNWPPQSKETHYITPVQPVLPAKSDPTCFWSDSLGRLLSFVQPYFRELSIILLFVFYSLPFFQSIVFYQ